MVLNECGRYNIMKLKRLGVLIPFMREAKKRFKTFDNSDFQQIINMSHSSEVINFALVWAATKEGWEFWNKKNKSLKISDLFLYSRRGSNPGHPD